MECDVAVLGGGPGGYPAAIRAAQLGASVICVEQETELGGTCLRVGCIPTKAWVQTAFALKEANETFEKLGVKVGPPELDFATAQRWKEGVVKQLTGGVAALFKANGVEWVKGTGRFKDANTLAVASIFAIQTLNTATLIRSHMADWLRIRPQTLTRKTSATSLLRPKRTPDLNTYLIDRR